MTIGDPVILKCSCHKDQSGIVVEVWRLGHVSVKLGSGEIIVPMTEQVEEKGENHDQAQ